MFTACRVQWQGENYSLYWVLLEHKKHRFYVLMLQIALLDWQGAQTHQYQYTHLFCTEGSEAAQHVSYEGSSQPHLQGCSIVADRPVLKKTLWSFLALHSHADICSITITQPCTKLQCKRLGVLDCWYNLHLAFGTSSLGLMWGGKWGATVLLCEQKMRACYEPQGSWGIRLTALARWWLVKNKWWWTEEQLLSHSHCWDSYRPRELLNSSHSRLWRGQLPKLLMAWGREHQATSEVPGPPFCAGWHAELCCPGRSAWEQACGLFFGTVAKSCVAWMTFFKGAREWAEQVLFGFTCLLI